MWLSFLQSPPVRLYHFYRDAEEAGLDLKYFDLDQPPLVFYDEQGQRLEQSAESISDQKDIWDLDGDGEVLLEVREFKIR